MNESSFKPGCGFFTESDLDGWLEGRLSPERREELERHVDSACSECVTLAADLAAFRQLIVGGILESERKDAEALGESVRSRLLQAVRKRETER